MPERLFAALGLATTRQAAPHSPAAVRRAYIELLPGKADQAPASAVAVNWAF